MVAKTGRHCSSKGYLPNKIMRYFSVMTPQHAPTPSTRHALKSGFHEAVKIAQLKALGMAIASMSKMIIVMMLVITSLNKLRLSQGTRPWLFLGAGLAAIGSKICDVIV